MSFACLCLAGPTASGKTAASLAIASALAADAGVACAVEIVSVDSALVYRGMDIGTAKPGAAERASVPHHLIDIIDPREAYSAARFVADATRLVDDINARGRLPLLVGGTMLYFKALFDGLDALPPADPAVRAGIDALAAAHGWPAVHAELARVDPVSAARLAPHDAQRVQRALEVYRLSGQPLSALHTGGHAQGGPPRPAPPPMISLEPTDRTWLHHRIEQRFAQMLSTGLVDEVRRLRARGDLHADLPSMRCVGYRQIWQALDTSESSPDTGEILEKGVAATRQLAKRQLTWLRSMPHRRAVVCDGDDVMPQVLHLARTLSASWARQDRP